jgi:hypothetical protein
MRCVGLEHAEDSLAAGLRLLCGTGAESRLARRLGSRCGSAHAVAAGVGAPRGWLRGGAAGVLFCGLRLAHWSDKSCSGSRSWADFGHDSGFHPVTVRLRRGSLFMASTQDERPEGDFAGGVGWPVQRPRQKLNPPASWRKTQQNLNPVRSVTTHSFAT